MVASSSTDTARSAQRRRRILMPRRAAAGRRPVMPDAVVQQPPRHAAHQQDHAGRQEARLAERIVYGAFDIVEKKTNEDPLSVFKKAMDNVRPDASRCKPKSRRRRNLPGAHGGQLPPRHHAGYPLDRRLLAQPHASTAMAERLANEIMDASDEHGRVP